MKNIRLTALFLMTMLVSSMLAGCHNTNENNTTQVTEHSTEAAEETEATVSSSTEALSEPETSPADESQTGNSTTEATTTPQTAESTIESATSKPTADATTETSTAESTTPLPTAESTTEAIETSTAEITTEVYTSCPTIETTTAPTVCPPIESTTEATESTTEAIEATTEAIEATTEAPEVPTTEEETEPETDAPTTSAPIVSGSYSLNLAKEAFDIMNQYRADAGLPALTWSDSLYASSQVRAKEIKTKFSHTRPDGTSCFTAFERGWRGMGENILYGTGSSRDTAKEAMTAWYNSQGHRENMLNKGFNHAAVACYYENGAYYWVTLFGFQ